MRIVRASEMAFEPASHENPLSPGVLKKVLAKRSDLLPGKVQMINWARMPEGRSFSRHYHEAMEEIFIIVQGQARIEIASETATLNSGDLVLIPPRAEHVMTNIGSGDLDYIVVGIIESEGGKTVVLES